MSHCPTKRADGLLLVKRRSGIANLSKFTDAPLLLMYGFMCVAATAALWDNFATYLALPVSTTHTTGVFALLTRFEVVFPATALATATTCAKSAALQKVIVQIKSA